MRHGGGKKPMAKVGERTPLRPDANLARIVLTEETSPVDHTSALLLVAVWTLVTLCAFLKSGRGMGEYCRSQAEQLGGPLGAQLARILDGPGALTMVACGSTGSAQACLQVVFVELIPGAKEPRARRWLGRHVSCTAQARRAGNQ